MEINEKIQYLRFADLLQKAIVSLTDQNGNKSKSQVSDEKSTQKDEKSAKRSVSRAHKDGETKAKKKRSKDPNAPKRNM